MNEILSIKITLIKTLDDLGYEKETVVSADKLAEQIPRYMQLRTRDLIKDFTVIPESEVDLGGLSHRGFYAIYVKRK